MQGIMIPKSRAKIVVFLFIVVLILAFAFKLPAKAVLEKFTSQKGLFFSQNVLEADGLNQIDRLKLYVNELEMHLNGKKGNDILSSQFKGIEISNDSAAICLVQKDDVEYLDEFVNYHLALGFHSIYIMDNSNSSELLEWKLNRGSPEKVKIFPIDGIKVQKRAYRECMRLVKRAKYTWVMFLDTDEFLVLKHYDNVIDFAKEYVSQGHLGVNWKIFGSSNHTVYEARPMAERFQCAVNNLDKNKFIKSLIKVDDFGNIDAIGDPHFFPIKKGATLHDTSNKIFSGSMHEGPRDQAEVYHFYFKSQQEWIKKNNRGDVFFGKGGYSDGLWHGKPIPVGEEKNELLWSKFKQFALSDHDSLRSPPVCFNNS